MWFHTADTLYSFDTFNEKKNPDFFYNAAPSTRRKGESVGKPSLKKKKIEFYTTKTTVGKGMLCYQFDNITSLNYVLYIKMNRAE